MTRQAQYDHPCATQYLGSPSTAASANLQLLHQYRQIQQGLAPQRQPQHLPALLHTDFHQPNVLVPPNPYLLEEIPVWLRVYFKACPSLDQLLKWDLFGLPEMECFEAMLNRLFRDELEELVMK
jgi:scaffold protein salvador